MNSEPLIIYINYMPTEILKLDVNHHMQVNDVTSQTTNHISGIMVCMLASSAADCGFESRSGQTKDYKIGIC